ncbi:MAG: ribonuclease P protein component [Anaerolineae bacterium]|nr:MAG: ribonuclease P protein component [Anaerolineae bacterium]
MRTTDIERVRREGKTYAHPLLVLAALPNPGGDLRVAVIAGRGVGGAVQRSRAKRLLRAALQPLLETLPAGHDLTLVARKPILNQTSPQVQNALATCLRKAGLLENPQ